MLRSELWFRRNIDIRKYGSLLTFLKKHSSGYRSKKSKEFTKEEIFQFLLEADDRIFLMAKVAMIIGTAGACRKSELTYLRIEDVMDEQSHFRITIPSSKTQSGRNFVITTGDMEGINFVEIIRKYINLRPPEIKHNRFFIKYTLGRCYVQPVGINTFGNIPKAIAHSLKLPNPNLFTGHCFRRSAATLLRTVGPIFLQVRRQGAWNPMLELKNE